MIAEKFRAVLKRDCIKSAVEFAGMLMCSAKIKDKTRDEQKLLVWRSWHSTAPGDANENVKLPLNAV